VTPCFAQLLRRRPRNHPPRMASSQNTTYTSYKCHWGGKFDDLVKTGSDPATGEKYRFIPQSSLELIGPFEFQLDDDALLIRDEYEQLYQFLLRESSPIGSRKTYSGIAVIGQPGIGQLRLHCVSPEACLLVMCREVAVSAVCAPSPPVRKKAHRVSIRVGHHMDFQRR
jgi:hypothetical protein